METRILAVAALGAAVLAGPVLACGGGPMNLVATPTVKEALRSAYLRAHPEVRTAQVGEPARGRTYYGDFMGTRYAVATFATHPTIFRTDARGRWKLVRQTRGGICTEVVPLELVRVWWLEHRRGRCFVEPR